MNGDEVLKLIEAGFTAEEIRKMQTEPEPENKEKESGASGLEHESEVKTGDINTDFMDAIKKEMTELKDTVKAIQENNVKTAKQESKRDLTAADVVKSFIENT